MFTKNVYMFPSSHNSDELFLHHHGMLPTHYSAGDPLPAANQCTTGKASKKDRHNKIYTAQGPRDRRVRLSIAVARKFFDLQESLGFDKPSKTLDWLLTKSKGDIKDLVQMREKGSSDAAKDGSSEYEVDSKNGADLKLKGAAKNPTPAFNLAKESRVKARARARERTREKMMSIKKLNNNGSYELNPTIPIQFINNQLKISGSSSNINVGTMLHSHYPNFESANDHQDLIQESIVIKRKVKHHPSILGFQQNFIISSSNYGVPSPYNAAADQNWDVSSCFTSSHSNI